LSAVNGIAAAGTWTLQIQDAAAGDTGTLLSWSLILTTPSGYTCNACVIAPPGEATQLLFTAKDTVTWSAASGATDYYLYRGTSADLPNLLNGSVDSCQRGTTTGLSLSGLTEAPAGLQWFLVRGSNGGGLGPAGNATAGPRTQDSSGTCP
jgi:hypothetical protein